MSKGELRLDETVGNLPLVSVIVVNYNYGKYLEEAVSSVFQQTYGRIECVIVDDCSTDNSIEVINGLQQRFCGIIFHENEVNSGQSLSSLNGFLKSTGDYVIFLDADDYLMPTCVEVHVMTHLSLRIAVGLTSVDMIQLNNDRIVTTTSQGFSEFIRSGKGLGQNILRGNENLNLPEDSSSVIDKNTIHYVHPSFSNLWPWSPTSGNCFRREALGLVIDNESFRSLRSCSDIYLLRGVASLTGSALIDCALAAYRLHGDNAFIRSAPVHRMRTYNTKYLEQKSNVAMVMIIDHIMNKFVYLADRLESPYYLIEALNSLDRVWPPIGPRRYGLTYLGQSLLLNRRMIARVLGHTIFNDWLLQSILPRPFEKLKKNIFYVMMLHIIGFISLPFIWIVSVLIGASKNQSERS